MRLRPARTTKSGIFRAYCIPPSGRHRLHPIFHAVLTILFTLLAAGSAAAGTLYVQNGASLTGYDGAAINGTTHAESGGAVVPNAGPGCNSHTDLFLASGSILEIELGGTTACTGYDSITVSNSVTLTGSTLDLSAYNGFVPSILDRFIIINNGGGTAVTGTFAGLAEGSEVNLSGVALTVSYQSGDGNDVALTARSSQTITFNTLSGKTYGDTDFSLTASASSGLSVGFSSQTPSVCSVSGSTVSILAAGTCTIRAGQPGNSYYYAAPDVEQSFDVSIKALSVTGLAAQDKTYDGTTVATLIGSPLLNGVVPGDIVSLSGTAVGTFSDAGAAVNKTVTITGLILTGADAENYFLASSFTTTATIGKANQIITFGTLPDRNYGDADFSISASADSGLPISFTSTTPGTCTVSGATISLIAVGTCSVTASQAGDTNYNAAADVIQSFMVRATVTSSAGANGSISPSGTQYADYNTTLVFTIKPDTGYHLLPPVGGTCGGSFTGNPSDPVNGVTFTTSNITSNCTVTPAFAINQYTVTAVAGANGNLDPATPSPVTLNHGETTTFTFNADTGYHVSGVSGCGINSLNGDQSVTTLSETTEAITGDCTVNAVFSVNTYQLSILMKGRGNWQGTVASDSGGILCPDTCIEQYDYGTVVGLTPATESGSKFLGWSGDPDCEDGSVSMTTNVNCIARFYRFPWLIFMNAITADK